MIGKISAAPKIEHFRTMTFDAAVKAAAAKVGVSKLASAFHDSKFVYGTMGRGSEAVRLLKAWASRPRRTDKELEAAGYKINSPTTVSESQRQATVKAADPKNLQYLKNVIQSELNLFDPGVRANIYLSGEFQMMDQYYGQAGNELYKKRNPAIAEFVHYVMGYKGPFSMDISGRDIFMKSYGTSLEGYDYWTPGGPRIRGNTATVEISKAIRWGIQEYGGMLIFEGKQVFYSQVFNQASPKVTDTDKEAIALFEYFERGKSVAKFGNGRLAFYWGGRLTVPTQCHFLSNWGFGGVDSQKRPVMHTKDNRKDFAAYMQGPGVQLRTTLWNKFIPAPVCMMSMYNAGMVEEIYYLLS